MSRPADPHAKIDLLRAAEEVYLEHGLEKARIEDITGRAGRSKGAFYLHFESKEDAFRQIVEAFLARLSGCIDRSNNVFMLADRDPQAFLASCREVDLEVLEFMWQNRGVVQLMLEGGGSSEFGYLIDEFAERSRQNTKQLLRWGVDQGLYRADLDVEVGSLVISGAYDRVVRDLVRQNRKPDLQALVTALQQMLLNGAAGAELREVSIGSIDSRVKNHHQRGKRA
jgi:AcrR family transcriptional regulator